MIFRLSHGRILWLRSLEDILGEIAVIHNPYCSGPITNRWCCGTVFVRWWSVEERVSVDQLRCFFSLLQEAVARPLTLLKRPSRFEIYGGGLPTISKINWFNISGSKAQFVSETWSSQQGPVFYWTTIGGRTLLSNCAVGSLEDTCEIVEGHDGNHWNMCRYTVCTHTHIHHVFSHEAMFMIPFYMNYIFMKSLSFSWYLIPLSMSPQVN